MAVFRQLIVGTARDDIHVQNVDRVIVDHRPEGARGKDVGIYRIDLVRTNRPGPKLANDPVNFFLIDVSHDQVGTLFVERLAEIVSHMAEALNRDRLVAK